MGLGLGVVVVVVVAEAVVEPFLLADSRFCMRVGFATTEALRDLWIFFTSARLDSRRACFVLFLDMFTVWKEGWVELRERS